MSFWSASAVPQLLESLLECRIAYPRDQAAANRSELLVRSRYQITIMFRKRGPNRECASAAMKFLEVPRRGERSNNSIQHGSAIALQGRKLVLSVPR